MIGRNPIARTATLPAPATPPADAGPVPGRRAGVDAEASGVGDIVSAFLRWLEARQEGERLWPAFDRFVRDLLMEHAGARHVRLFQVVDGPERVRPLVTQTASSTPPVGTPTAFDPPGAVRAPEAGPAAAWCGLLDHVLASGRRYVRGDWSHGPLVDRLAAESARCGSLSGEAAWIFPIRDIRPGSEPGPMGRQIGVVVVGELPESRLADRAALDALANVVNEFWLHVKDHEDRRLALRTDRGSGVLTRADFLDAAEAVFAEAWRDGEPVVVLALSVEGLRALDDNGHWDLRDRIVEQAGRVLRRKIRSDDCAGRFSDDRFVVLLRRVDLSLGRLIAEKIVEAVRGVLSGEEVATACLKVRCGLAGGGCRGTSGGLAGLMKRALSATGVARRRGQDILVAEDPPPAPGSEQP